MKKFKSTLASVTLKRQSMIRTEPGILSQEVPMVDIDNSLENFDFEQEMKGFFENIRGNFTTKAVNIVKKIFKEFEGNLDKITENNVILQEKPGNNKKRSTSLKVLKEKTGKIGKKRDFNEKISVEKLSKRVKKGDKSIENLMKKEENQNFMEEEVEKIEEKRGFAKKIKEFVNEIGDGKVKEEGESEKNVKKRRLIGENEKFSEFLESFEEGEVKKKKGSKKFL